MWSLILIFGLDASTRTASSRRPRGMTSNDLHSLSCFIVTGTEIEALFFKKKKLHRFLSQVHANFCRTYKIQNDVFGLVDLLKKKFQSWVFKTGIL